MAVVLSVTSGPAKGEVFTFTEHDTFLFERMPNCHASLPDDTQVSRHHFILEACPPKASLRDLGSLNGTYVNGKKCGGRKAEESPEEGAKHKFPGVELSDGDKITVGQTDLAVAIEKGAAQPAVEAGMKPGELSELSPDQLFRLVFGDGKNKTGLWIPGYSVENVEKLPNGRTQRNEHDRQHRRNPGLHAPGADRQFQIRLTRQRHFQHGSDALFPADWRVPLSIFPPSVTQLMSF